MSPLTLANKQVAEIHHCCMRVIRDLLKQSVNSQVLWGGPGSTRAQRQASEGFFAWGETAILVFLRYAPAGMTLALQRFLRTFIVA